jgi:hypothetical protein
MIFDRDRPQEPIAWPESRTVWLALDKSAPVTLGRHSRVFDKRSKGFDGRECSPASNAELVLP